MALRGLVDRRIELVFVLEVPRSRVLQLFQCDPLDTNAELLRVTQL